MDSVYIVAEAGVNHNGNEELAYQLIDAAVEAGANAVKFQIFKAANLVIKSTGKADYQKCASGSAESQFDMLQRLELPYGTYNALANYCKEKNIDFLSTAFDVESLDFLVNGLNVNKLKISSGDITNGPFLLAHANAGLEVILSTGMSTLDEIEEALGVLAYGFIQYIDGYSEPPSREEFHKAYMSIRGRELIKKNVTLLHCTTEYPAPLDEINLRAMPLLEKKFGTNVGYSDHSEGVVVPATAAAMGAYVIEKHFTLDKQLPGPDHKASLEPKELSEMVNMIRVIERVRGHECKEAVDSEKKNIPVVRKSLVAAREIQKGDILCAEDIAIKRPGTGKGPMEYWNIIGAKSDKKYFIDDLI